MSFFKKFGISRISELTEESPSFSGSDMIRRKVTDDELRNVIVENRLEMYIENFLEMEVKYADLPNLTKERMKELIPDKIPRKRLEKFVKSNFIQKKDSEGWEIDPSIVKIDNEKVISSGAYGSIKLGEIDFGYRTKVIACKEIPIDGKVVTKENVVNELCIMSYCHSPYVLKSYGGYFSQDEKVATICMEYLPEGDLLKFSAKNKNNEVDWNPYSKLKILMDISRALVYLHNKQIVHRDIKPSNILLIGDRAKLCDFGHSKLVNNMSKSVVGTPAFLPPEAFHRRNSDNPFAMDIYSFGILSWQILTDERPYAALRKKYPKDPLGFCIAIHGKPGSKGKSEVVRPDLSHDKLNGLDEIIEVMELCWEERPEFRPSAREVLSELMSFERILRKKYREDDDEEIDW